MRTLLKPGRGLALIVCAYFALFGCESSPTSIGATPLDLSAPWVEVSPVEANVDEEGLDDAVAKAEALPRFRSLLAVHKGRLVLEQYFHGNTADTLTDVRAVTASVLSTLLGVAIGTGHITSLDETLGDYLHPDVAELDSARQAITIGHLLTMSSGFEWDEGAGSSYSDWIRSQDQVDHVLGRPLLNTPGSTFTYNSGAVHLLGVLLREATGMPLADFAARNLLGPIGIQRTRWETVSRGDVNGGDGIHLRPRDMARLGQLYLQEGVSGDRQILPRNWTNEATRTQSDWRASFGALDRLSYGYLWAVAEDARHNAYLAWGFGGQIIFVAPTLDLVVVTTTDWRGVRENAGPGPHAGNFLYDLERAALDVIINDVVRAVRCKLPDRPVYDVCASER